MGFMVGLPWSQPIRFGGQQALLTLNLAVAFIYCTLNTLEGTCLLFIVYCPHLHNMLTGKFFLLAEWFSLCFGCLGCVFCSVNDFIHIKSLLIKKKYIYIFHRRLVMAFRCVL